MLSIKLNNRVYELPLGELYRDKFNIYIKNDILDLDNLDLNIKYRKTDELFGFVTRSFQMFMGSYEEEPNFRYKDEVLNLRRKVSPADSLQRFFAKNNDYKRSIETMNNVIEQILKFYTSFIQEENMNMTKTR